MCGTSFRFHFLDYATDISQYVSKAQYTCYYIIIILKSIEYERQIFSALNNITHHIIIMLKTFFVKYNEITSAPNL